MTALVSWCDSSQSWMAGLPVDESVPMAFRMGQATQLTVTMLKSGGQFPFAGCRTSLGLELYRGQVLEDSLRPRTGQRAYFFLDFDKWSAHYIANAREVFRP
jgi:hypothetical protein